MDCRGIDGAVTPHPTSLMLGHLPLKGKAGVREVLSDACCVLSVRDGSFDSLWSLRMAGNVR